MEVNFNNLRKQTCLAYDSLTKKLNNAITQYEKGYSEKRSIFIDCDEIQEEMDELKSLIGSIAMCYEENNADMEDVFEKLYTDGNSMLDFNPESE
jgi:hypothetical protein